MRRVPSRQTDRRHETGPVLAGGAADQRRIVPAGSAKGAHVTGHASTVDVTTELLQELLRELLQELLRELL